MKISFESLEFGVSRNQSWSSLCWASWMELVHGFVLSCEICGLERKSLRVYKIAEGAEVLRWRNRNVENLSNFHAFELKDWCHFLGLCIYVSRSILKASCGSVYRVLFLSITSSSPHGQSHKQRMACKYCRFWGKVCQN